MFAIILFSCLFYFIIEVIYTVPVKTLYNILHFSRHYILSAVCSKTISIFIVKHLIQTQVKANTVGDSEKLTYSGIKFPPIFLM